MTSERLKPGDLVAMGSTPLYGVVVSPEDFEKRYNRSLGSGESCVCNSGGCYIAYPSEWDSTDFIRRIDPAEELALARKQLEEKLNSNSAKERRNIAFLEEALRKTS